MCGQKQLSTLIWPGMDILSRDKIISNIKYWLIDWLTLILIDIGQSDKMVVIIVGI